MAVIPRPDSDTLLALAAKYRALLALRRRRDSGSEDVDRTELKALSAAHPGCLRELDTLGEAELLHRQRALEEAARGGPTAPWMAWIFTFHQVLKAALTLKPRLTKEALEPGLEEALLREAERVAGFPLPPSFVREVARPPERRLAVAVLRTLGGIFAVSPHDVSHALFPSRRPMPNGLS